jgi:hypothetical protein
MIIWLNLPFFLKVNLCLQRVVDFLFLAYNKLGLSVRSTSPFISLQCHGQQGRKALATHLAGGTYLIYWPKGDKSLEAECSQPIMECGRNIKGWGIPQWFHQTSSDCMANPKDAFRHSCFPLSILHSRAHSTGSITSLHLPQLPALFIGIPLVKYLRALALASQRTKVHKIMTLGCLTRAGPKAQSSKQSLSTDKPAN